jgi:hypothetical protein
MSKSKMVKDLGRYDMHSMKFTNSQTGKQIIPWEGKAAFGYEWFRNESAFNGYCREESAIFSHIEKDARIYTNDMLLQDRTADLAIFFSSSSGEKFDVAARLVPKLEQGDQVVLTILGCCSLISIKRADE